MLYTLVGTPVTTVRHTHTHTEIHLIPNFDFETQTARDSRQLHIAPIVVGTLHTAHTARVFTADCANLRTHEPPIRASGLPDRHITSSRSQSFIHMRRKQGPLWHDKALLLLHVVEQAAHAHHDEQSPPVRAAVGTVLPLQ